MCSVPSNIISFQSFVLFSPVRTFRSNEMLKTKQNKWNIKQSPPKKNSFRQSTHFFLSPILFPLPPSRPVSFLLTFFGTSFICYTMCVCFYPQRNRYLLFYATHCYCRRNFGATGILPKKLICVFLAIAAIAAAILVLGSYFSGDNVIVMMMTTMNCITSDVY